MDIESTIDTCSTVFDGIDTKWKQDRYFEKNKSLIVPRKIPLDPAFKKGKQPKFGENRSIDMIQESLMYISIVDIIKSFMSNPSYVKLLQCNKSPTPGVFKSLEDCIHFKDNAFFRKNKDSLQILLYYDDINLNDTASSRPQKMAMFYFTLANLCPSRKSSLKFIYLTLPVESEFLDDYPLEIILQPLVKDLIELEKGVTLDDGRIVHGGVASFLGDNLASHRIGGFKKGFLATYPCRTCKMNSNDIRCTFKEDATLLRTVEQYDDNVKLLKQCKTDKEATDLSKEFGLNGYCPFNDLESFHAINSLPPDIFHDIFEGCILKTVHLVLIHFLTGKDKFMSPQDFNAKLMEFDYGYSETKPSKILPQHLKVDANLHQTGIQIWSLAVITLLILGPLIEYGNKYWDNYMSLLQITSIICGEEISIEMVGFLEHEIESYLRSFVSLYHCNLTPKQHFLIHYPRLIVMFGPLYNYNTLRWEGKHQYFKDMMRKLKNMKNPPVSMAKQHQLYQVSIAEGFKETKEYGVLKIISFIELPYRNILPPELSAVNSLSWIKLDGIEYRAEKCFIMTNYVEALPEFNLIVAIVYLDEKLMFVCKNVRTNEYNTHINAYNIDVTEDYRLIKINEVYTHAVYHAHYINKKYFIIVKRAAGNIF